MVKYYKPKWHYKVCTSDVSSASYFATLCLGQLKNTRKLVKIHNIAVHINGDKPGVLKVVHQPGYLQQR